MVTNEEWLRRGLPGAGEQDVQIVLVGHRPRRSAERGERIYPEDTPQKVTNDYKRIGNQCPQRRLGHRWEGVFNVIAMLDDFLNPNPVHANSESHAALPHLLHINRFSPFTDPCNLAGTVSLRQNPSLDGRLIAPSRTQDGKLVLDEQQNARDQISRRRNRPPRIRGILVLDSQYDRVDGVLKRMSPAEDLIPVEGAA